MTKLQSGVAGIYSPNLNSQLQTAVPAATPEVQLHVGSLEQHLLALHSALDSLTGRLEPVLSNYGSGSLGDDAKREAGASPLGETLMRLDESVQGATARVHGLLNRLEV